jgi:hypothetical protein
LRLALDEPRGLRGMRASFRARAKTETGDRAAEAMLAQIDDLQSRLAALDVTPERALDDEERASEWLKKKAFKRVWHDRPNAKTHAMNHPPRRVLELRALRGHWPSFPQDPAQYEPLFRGVARDARGSRWSDTASVAMRFEDIVEAESQRLLCPYRRLALHRCALTVIIECMDLVDDSGGDMGEAYRSIERRYVEFVREAELDVLLRDLLELVIWEDYGLTQAAESLLGTLTEERADIAVRELARIMAELRTHELAYPLDCARRVRALVLSSMNERAAPDLESD